jgi:hypothetical protein
MGAASASGAGLAVWPGQWRRGFVVDDLGARLVSLLADAGRRKLVAFALGDEQVRALLHQACRAALTVTAAELRPGDAAAADEVAMVVGEVFKIPTPQPAGEYGTVLEDLRAPVPRAAAQLAVLDDPDSTPEPGSSSAGALGVSAREVAEKLASSLVWEITGRGGPLEPLASQLGHDRSFLLGPRLEGKIDHMDSLLAAMLAVLGEARPATRGQERAAGATRWWWW